MYLQYCVTPVRSVSDARCSIRRRDDPVLFGDSSSWDFADFVGCWWWTDNVSTSDCVLLLCSMECLGAVVASAMSDSDWDTALLLRRGTWCL